MFTIFAKNKHGPDLFRKHPNDKFGYQYYKYRLKSIGSELHCFDDGTKNLYDIFESITHHITAYSSCCYEARAFGIDTLLFGEDAFDIYNEEIRNNVFSTFLNKFFFIVRDVCNHM